MVRRTALGGVVEIRVHGIGGTTAQSMLGLCPDDSLVPLWPLGAEVKAHLWAGDDPAVAAYHWAPLTSGSRWFALWPLLLPFTLLNVAGFMHPRGALGRVGKAVHGALCYATTVWFASWLVLAGQIVADDRDEAVGLAGSVALAVAVVWVTGIGNRRQRSAPPTHRSGVGGRGLSDPGFFTTGRLLWATHVAAVAATVAGIYLARPGSPGGLRRQASDAVVASGGVIMALLLVLAVLAAGSYVAGSPERRGPLAWAFRTVGAAGLGAAMIGGLLVALLRVLVDDKKLRGPAFVLFDVYGWAVLGAVAVGVTAAVVILVRKSPGELVREIGGELLPNPVSWFRARVALLPRAAIAALGAATLTFLVVGTWQFSERAPHSIARWLRVLDLEGSVSATERMKEAGWHITATPSVRIAQTTIYWLFGFMVLNVVRSKASPNALRRVGSVWDVLTFWPRRFHPFAVRPYPAQAIPQLQELLISPAESAGASWRVPPLVVLAHSQGAMLVVAALGPIGAAGERSQIDHLVTVGCPLRSLYIKAFPSYCDEELISDVSRALVPPSRWSNVFRFTDHVGRTVFREETSQEPGDLKADGPVRIWCWERRPAPDVVQQDCAVADPRERQKRVDGHNDYWADDRIRKVVTGA